MFTNDQWTALYEAYAPQLRRYVIHMTGGEHDDVVADICAETWLRVFLQIDRYEERGSFLNWLGTIAKYQWLAIVTARRRRAQISFSAENEECLGLVAPGDLETTSIQVAFVEALLAKLEPERRALVWTWFHGGYTYPELGAVFGLSGAVAQQRVYAALADLRLLLGENLPPLPTSTLSATMQHDARRLYVEGRHTARELADMFGVGVSTMERCVRGLKKGAANA